MSIFTATELDTHIAAYKQALLDLSAGKSVSVDTGSGRRNYETHEIEAVRRHLEWLSAERDKLDTGSARPAGRTYAKNGGGRWQ
jgi:hypothetical protein